MRARELSSCVLRGMTLKMENLQAREAGDVARELAGLLSPGDDKPS